MSTATSRLEGERGARHRWGGVVRGVLFAVLVVVLLLALWIVALLLTNPSPRESDDWSRHADLPGGRGESASAVRGDELFVIGGFTGAGSTSDVVHVYDVAADEWRRAPDLPDGRHHAAGAVLDDQVYLSGGATSALDWTPRTNFWVLSEGDDTWRAGDPMPEGRQGHDMVAVGGSLVVVGGEGDSTAALVHEDGEGWRMGAELGEVRDHVRAAVVDGEVWAIGGRNGSLTDAVAIYDLAADEWRNGPSLPRPMSAMAVGVIDGTVHVVGGEDESLFGGRVFDDHFVLADGAEEWQEAPEPILPVHGASFGVVDDRLFVTGGSPRQGFLSPLAWSTTTQSYPAE